LDFSGNIFIDRNPQYFKYILDVFRDGELDLSGLPQPTVFKVAKELEYYGVAGALKPWDSDKRYFQKQLAKLAHINQHEPQALQWFDKNIENLVANIKLRRKPHDNPYIEFELVLQQGSSTYLIAEVCNFHPIGVLSAYTKLTRAASQTTIPGVWIRWQPCSHRRTQTHQKH